MATTVKLTEAEWRQRLKPEQYRVLREAATEAPFVGEYVENHEAGEYRCAGCGARLFSSETKFDSGTGWPSFYDPIEAGAVVQRKDWKMLLPRTEIRCAACESHLGHVFDDGPNPTGKRYCMNSCALDFQKGGKNDYPGETAG